MSRVLVIVPTEFERQRLFPWISPETARAGGIIETCGFGPIASGIRTTQLLAQYAPDSVVLIGIAGTMGPQLPVGTARSFLRIGCYGIGAGSGCDFQTAQQLGWFQAQTSGGDQTFGDVIDLKEVAGENPSDDDVEIRPQKSFLLTVCSASANPQEVLDKLRAFPQASAEDMEAYAVAMACRMANVPLTVIRGISNIAGDRDKTHWDVEGALKSAADVMLSGHFL